MSDPSDATPEDPQPATATDETVHPPQDGQDARGARITTDPDAPGAYIDDEETPDVPEPNEPA